MTRPVLLLLLPVALAACVPSASELDRVRLTRAGTECQGPAARACFFEGAPVVVRDQPVRLQGRSLDFFRTARLLEFIDNQRGTRVAPAETQTDGASIPLLFVPLVGSPQSPEFRAAAALHDAYCGIGNESGPVYHRETWPRVHRMFYDALVAGGVAPVKAKVMFAAVWLGGPRWQPKGEPGATGGDGGVWSPARLPDEVQLGAMRRTKAYIERNDPPMDLLLIYLGQREREMQREAAQPLREDRVPAPVREPEQENPETPGEGSVSVPAETVRLPTVSAL